jgi:two-component system, OmpR family, KDP operon response regulator KdpE
MSSNPGSILVVTEAASVYAHLQHNLEPSAFSLQQAGDLTHALLCLRADDYDVVLLDRPNLGEENTAACRQIRDLYPQLPLFVLVDYDHFADRVDFLNAGADDLVVRPIAAPRAFSARLRSAIRRYRLNTPVSRERLVVGDLMLDLARHCVQRSGCEIALTPLEFRALQLLMAQADKPITHARLLATLWGPEYTQHREYLRVLMHGLRKKLEEDPAQPVYLLTHSHFGYLFRAARPQGQAAMAG